MGLLDNFVNPWSKDGKLVQESGVLNTDVLNPSVLHPNALSETISSDMAYDYYTVLGGQIIYLGTNAGNHYTEQEDTEMRYVNPNYLSQFREISKRNVVVDNLLLQVSENDLSKLNKISTKIIIQAKEKALVANLLERGYSDNIELVKELGFSFYFDPKKSLIGIVVAPESQGTLTAHRPVPDILIKARAGKHVIPFGDLHTHSLADHFEAKGEDVTSARDPQIQTEDRDAAKKEKKIVYSIDSKVILRHTPIVNNAFAGTKPASSIKMPQSTNEYLNSKFSIIRDGFEMIAGKQ